MRWQRLVLVWVLVNAFALTIAFLWQGPPQGTKFAVLLGGSTATILIYVSLRWRRFLRSFRKLESYVASVPRATEISTDLPSALRPLYAALKRTSEHVDVVIERANVELERRETILAGMAEGVLAVDDSLHVTFCNEAFARSFRTRLPLPQGRPLFEVVREPRLRDILSFVVSGAKPLRERMHLPSADGRWFEVHALPLGGTVSTGAIAVLHDVTDLQLQEQARKDFVANVSHELRTPLAAIRGYAETLLDGGLEDAENSRRFVEVIQSHATRLTNITADLLVLSELDSHAPTAALKPVSMDDVIEAAIHTVQPSAEARNISFHRSICEGCIVLGSRLRLEQVLVNLLDNAVKFNKPGGSVTIKTIRENLHITVEVADTGIGLARDDLRRVFDRFYRVDKARSREAGGTGLGLSIVKESVERMGGSVSVESQLGQGCRFALRLPAA
jgi:two-component system phosphate regulon sensor histidine kinase PhoR